MVLGTSGTGVIWGRWVDLNCTTASTASDTDYLWTTWSDTTTSASVTWASEDTVWRNWQWWMNNGTRTPAIHVARPRVDPRVAEEANRAAREKWKIRQEAQQRAEELLLAHLDDQQRAEYRDKKCFHVIGQDGQRYRLDATKHHQNIRRVVDNRAVEEFCIYMKGAIPLADNLLAQKMMLECDVQELKRIANSFRLNDVQHRRTAVG